MILWQDVSLRTLISTMMGNWANKNSTISSWNSLRNRRRWKRKLRNSSQVMYCHITSKKESWHETGSGRQWIGIATLMVNSSNSIINFTHESLWKVKRNVGTARRISGPAKWHNTGNVKWHRKCDTTQEMWHNIGNVTWHRECDTT